MRFLPGCLLLVLLVTSLSPVHGVLEALNTNLKCQCTKTVSFWNKPKMVSFIDIFPPGNSCPNMEVIVRTKTKSNLCLNPDSKWTRSLLKDVLKKFATLNSPVRIRIRKA
ncbi:C-X-C motif chemokine 13 [Molossus molossus]|uniref:C-X-C motif chemokine ligand 13 n=1 Tax=Molossus molossus TaxID=27622 RepID=A0A7J8JS32_MOLMO|nr:C-X-C motif chemokine 13 [Molossus molossus]KAF6499673.1 C-X-C motif chemokine ligand 13 [Molossus molossus]